MLSLKGDGVMAIGDPMKDPKPAKVVEGSSMVDAAEPGGSC